MSFLSDLIDSVTQAPSWLDRAVAEMQRGGEAYQRGGVPALMADTGAVQDLAGGFAGTTTPAKGLPIPKQVAPSGITAYHGSPYDFEKFDLSKIGTGEGAQAYGHGLYFAENPEVAKSYRPIPGTSSDPNYTSRMYEVNINAHPEDFIQWDKPLSEQPKAVQDYFSARGMQPDPNTGRTMGDELRWTGMNSRTGSRILSERGVPGISYLDQFSRAQAARADRLINNPVQQTLDAINPQTTKNYVVFNPAIIDILRKYGLAGMLGGGTAMAMQGQQAPELSQ